MSATATRERKHSEGKLVIKSIRETGNHETAKGTGKGEGPEEKQEHVRKMLTSLKS